MQCFSFFASFLSVLAHSLSHSCSTCFVLFCFSMHLFFVFVFVFQFIALVLDFNLYLFIYLFFTSRVLILFVPTDSQARMVIVTQQFTFKRNKTAQAANTERCITSLNNCDNHRQYQCLFVCTIPSCIKKAVPAVLGSGVTHFIT